MTLQDKDYKLTVSTSEIDVATKFYEDVIGLSIRKSTKDKVVFSGNNYDILIKSGP